jgi:CheY-like chemotaxis protein
MKKILVIEDNDLIRENTAELLELSHYEVFTAMEGKTGFDLAKEYRPDLILCDLLMPKTDGQKFLALAKEDEIVKHIPIIFFSAGSAQAIQKDLVLHADGFLKKPFSEQDLLSTIDRIFI